MTGWANPVKCIQDFRQLFISPCKLAQCGDEEGVICVCHAITPILRYSQFFGVAPITLHTPVEESSPPSHPQLGALIKSKVFIHAGGPLGPDYNAFSSISPPIKPKCYLSSSFSSLPSILNVVLLAGFICVTTWVIFNIQNFLKVYFEGTDFYTFGAQVLFLYTHSVLILANAFLQRKQFDPVWALLLKILKDLVRNHDSAISRRSEGIAIATILRNGQMVNPSTTFHTASNANLHRRLKYIRIFSWAVLIVVLISSLSHSLSFIHLVFYSCFDKPAQVPVSMSPQPTKEYELGKPPCPFSNYFLFLQKLFYSLIDYVQQGLVMLFSVVCLLVVVLYREIEEQLESALTSAYDIRETPSLGGLQLQCHVERLRMAYEDLKECCRLISGLFGVPVLGIMITSVVSITCALYSCALYSGAIDESFATVTRFYVIWAFHGWFGWLSLSLLLIPGQMISNASEGPSQVIGRCALAHLDEETKFQLSQFQHQSRSRVVLSAGNIASIGMGFLGAAATNVTTYILVILQFRLGVERDEDGKGPKQK